MSLFDFITAEDFRKSLETDYSEMSQCFDSKAWKAVHVLAGSIVEAVLIDHIVAEGLAALDDALRMDLGKAIALAKDKKTISSRTADLSSVVKEYRNLIHPGRLLRLKEETNEDSAKVAVALVHMMVNEIEKQKRAKYGYTAEEIVAKLRRDSSVNVIISHLVKKSNPIEIERLLLTVLPETYRQYCEDPLGDIIEFLPSSLSLCFRTAFDQANDELKRMTTQRFVKLLKEESESTISAYGQLFFRASDLKYLSTDDIDLVKKYLLNRLARDQASWLTTVSGIGAYIASDEVSGFVDPLVLMINSHETETSQLARERLDEEWWIIPSAIDHLVTERLEQWITHYRERNLGGFAEEIVQLKASHEIPF